MEASSAWSSPWRHVSRNSHPNDVSSILRRQICVDFPFNGIYLTKSLLHPTCLPTPNNNLDNRPLQTPSPTTPTRASTQPRPYSPTATITNYRASSPQPDNLPRSHRSLHTIFPPAPESQNVCSHVKSGALKRSTGTRSAHHSPHRSGQGTQTETSCMPQATRFRALEANPRKLIHLPDVLKRVK